jgi:hypothetical protein
MPCFISKIIQQKNVARAEADFKIEIFSTEHMHNVGSKIDLKFRLGVRTQDS